LLLKDVENAARRVAALELGSEWVGEKILPCAFFVCFQGIIEDKLEVGRCGSRVSMRHKGGSRIERRIVGSWVMHVMGDGKREERHASQTSRYCIFIIDGRHR
jgi:hypothetical protein